MVFNWEVFVILTRIFPANPGKAFVLARLLHGSGKQWLYKRLAQKLSYRAIFILKKGVNTGGPFSHPFKLGFTETFSLRSRWTTEICDPCKLGRRSECNRKSFKVFSSEKRTWTNYSGLNDIWRVKAYPLKRSQFFCSRVRSSSQFTACTIRMSSAKVKTTLPCNRQQWTNKHKRSKDRPLW